MARKLVYRVLTERKAGEEYIIAVDFDGTLCEFAYPEIGEEREAIIVALVGLRALGVKLILNTCRVNTVHHGCGAYYLDAAVEWCRFRGLEFDAVNENLPSRIALYGGDSRKISARIHLGDDAVEA